MSVSEHANYLLNEYGRLQFDYAAYCKPYGEALRNEARNNLEEYIAELEAEVTKCHELQDSYCDRIAESESTIERLIEAGKRLLDSLCTDPEEEKTVEVMNWKAVVDKANKEREK
jgi:hypothetical protein